jgi:hypothetical protein
MLRKHWLRHLRKANFARNAVRLAVASLAILAIVAPANAAIIVHDTWRDGTDTDPASPTYSENGTDTDLDGNKESAWFQGGTGTLDPVGAGGPLRGNLGAGGTSSATWTTYFTPEGSEINLANDGDSIKVTWIFTPTTIGGTNTSQNFRFGVVDTVVGVGSTRAVANGSLPGAAYTGYAVWGNMAPTLGNANPFQLRERTLMTPGNLFNTTGDFGGVLGNGATTGNAGYVSGTEYKMTWVMTRNGAGLDIDVRMAGGNLDGDGLARVALNDASANGGSFKFDTFGIRPSGATTTAELFDTKLFRVQTYHIPEPATMILLGLGGAALAMLRRRGC